MKKGYCLISKLQIAFYLVIEKLYFLTYIHLIDQHSITFSHTLTYRFAAEQTEMLAAAAPMAASLGGRASVKDSIWITPQPNAKLPLIIFHAKDDVNVPYAGSASPKKGGEREYISVENSIDFCQLPHP